MPPTSEFLYFIKTNDPARATLTPAERALVAAVEPPISVGGQVLYSAAESPADNTPGILLFHSAETGASARHVIDRRRMSWHPWAAPGVHVGLWDDLPPPTPESLARPNPVPGITLTLGDGRRWQIPTLLYETGASALPPAVTLDQTGAVLATPHRLYRDLLTTGMEARAFCLAFSEGQDVDPRRAIELAILALGVNYRITRAEIGILQLLTLPAIPSILYAMVGINIFDRLDQKKKTNQTSSKPASGPPDSSAATPSPSGG